MGVYRVFALTVAALGLVLVVFMMQATYDTSARWDHLLFAIGMPLSFLLPLLGVFLMVLGGIMFVHAGDRAGRDGGA